MGSGLILLVIVGAWLVVLVPRALRSSDTDVLGTVDRFHDAVRVLARRDRGSRVEDDAAVDDDEPLEVTSRRLPRLPRVPLLRRVRLRRPRRGVRPRATAATRRLRLLAVLVVLALASLVAAVLGPVWLLAPHLAVDLLLGAVVVQQHRAAVARAERDATAREQALAAQALAAQAEQVTVARRRPVHVAGIPLRMPPRPLPLGAPLTLRAVRAAEAPLSRGAREVRGAQGPTWSPVPVPPPMYLTAPSAPRRVRDLTRTAAAGPVERPADVLEHKRAVNDW